MIVCIVYVVVFLLVFFAASFAGARCSCYDPTRPDMLLLLVALALLWPVSVPLTAAIFLLMGIAILAKKLTGGAK